MVARGFVHLPQGDDRAARGNGEDSRCADAGRMGRASVQWTSRALWTLLVYRNTPGDFAAVRMSRLQCGARRTAGGLSLGRRGGVIDGKAVVGVVTGRIECDRPELKLVGPRYAAVRISSAVFQSHR